jgi:WD40 repeat protein
VYEISSGKELVTLPDQAAIHLQGVAFSPDSKRLATAGSDERIRVWDTGSGRNLLNIPSGHRGSIDVLAYSPDGKMLVTGSIDETAKIFDATSGSEMWTLPGHGRILCAVFSHDSALLIVGRYGSDEAAKLWDVSSKKPLHTLVSGGTVFGVSFSPDGHRAVTWSSTDGKGWDLVSHGELFTFSESGGTEFGIAYSPDGKRIATEKQVWDDKGRPFFSIPATGSGPLGVVRFAFSRDSKRLATVDGTFAKVWDLASQKEPLTLDEPLTIDNEANVRSLTFTSDGKFLASISDGWIVSFQPLEIEDLMTLAHRRFPRELSAEERQKYLHTKSGK